jgi:predicted O-linked N-acetylglucosamine transferase (SPINDLY family)
MAADIPRLAKLRAGLRQRMAASPLCDGKAYAAKVETAYREMWRGWCSEAT